MLHRCLRTIFVLLAVAIPSIVLGWSTSRISSTRNQHTRLQMSSDSNNLKVLGVCGGIGSGKSTACKLLVDHCKCLAHIDADKVAHAVYAPGSNAVKDVVAEFGQEIRVSDSDVLEIDRKKLGAIVFSERSQMAKLEQIVWPHVRTMLTDKIDELKEEFQQIGDDQQPVIVLEAAILLDAGWEDLLDGVWAVTVPSEQALKRLVETRGLTSEEAQKRIDAQASRKGIGSSLDKEVEEGVVQCVIVNDGGLDDLKATLQKSLEDPKCWK